MLPVSPQCHPSQSPQTHSHMYNVKYRCVGFFFNLNGVCRTVCCLTYTTYSTVHIHSFRKKYIFVYTAFTISYNRAVAGMSGWMDAFFVCVTDDLQCPQSPRNPLIIQHSRHYVSCIHISACPPAAWSRFICFVWPSVLQLDSLLRLPVRLF